MARRGVAWHRMALPMDRLKANQEAVTTAEVVVSDSVTELAANTVVRDFKSSASAVGLRGRKSRSVQHIGSTAADNSESDVSGTVSSAGAGTTVNGHVLRQFEIPRPGFPFIYLLLREGDVVYVGLTRNLLRRIAAHQAERSKRFDDVLYFRLVRSESPTAVEKSLIELYRPIYNVSHNREAWKRYQQGRVPGAGP